MSDPNNDKAPAPLSTTPTTKACDASTSPSSFSPQNARTSPSHGENGGSSMTRSTPPRGPSSPRRQGNSAQVSVSASASTDTLKQPMLFVSSSNSGPSSSSAASSPRNNSGRPVRRPQMQQAQSNIDGPSLTHTSDHGVKGTSSSATNSLNNTPSNSRRPSMNSSGGPLTPNSASLLSSSRPATLNTSSLRNSSVATAASSSTAGGMSNSHANDAASYATYGLSQDEIRHVQHNLPLTNTEHQSSLTIPPILATTTSGQKPLPPTNCPLFCCFYAEFDNVIGPTIRMQTPPNFMDQEIGLHTSEFHKQLQKTFANIAAATQQKEDEQKQSKEEEGEDLLNGSRSMDDNTDTETVNATNVHGISAHAGASLPPSVATDTTTMQAQQRNNLSIFEATREYIITGSELADEMVCLSTHNLHILARPSMIRNAKYERNSLLFSVGFVLRRGEDPRPFRPLLEKLAATLCTMEVESQFLSNPISSRPTLKTILEGMLVSLNSTQAEYNVRLDEANALHLKLFRPPRLISSPVPDYVVPVLLRHENSIQAFDWEITVNWVVPHIDGVQHTKQISLSAEVDIEMTRSCLRVLKYHGVLAFVDIFQYSNRYECTDLAAAMLGGNAPSLLKAAVEFVLKDKYSTSSHTDGSSHESMSHGSIRDSFQLASIPPDLPGSPLMAPQSLGEQPRYVMAMAPNNFQQGSVDSLTGGAHVPVSLDGEDLVHHSGGHPVVDGNPGLSRAERRRIQAALAQLYCACDRESSLQDVILSKLESSEASATSSLGGHDDESTTSEMDNGNFSAGSITPEQPPRTAAHNEPMESFQLSPTAEEKASPGEPLSSRKSSLSSGSRHGSAGSLFESQRQDKDGAELNKSSSKEQTKYGRSSAPKGPVKIKWKEAMDHIDIRRFVTFGVVSGLIRRVHEYPYVFGVDDAPEDMGSMGKGKGKGKGRSTVISRRKSFPEGQGAVMLQELRRIDEETRLLNKIELAMDGTRCDDELSCMFHRPVSELVELVKACPQKNVISVFATGGE